VTDPGSEGSPPPTVPPPGASGPQVNGPGATEAGSTAMQVEVERDGPPPPPHVRARRQRRRTLLIVLAVLVVVGTPIALAITSAVTGQDTPAATDDDGDPGPDADDGGDADPDLEPAPEATLDPPDLAQLDGLDATYGELLIDIDASEQVMLGFQEDLAEAFGGAGGDGEALLETVQTVANDRWEELLEVRERLSDSIDDDGAEEVRDTYVEHLDAWADYMQAIAEDPATMALDDGSSGYNVMINSTADTFARTLEDRLPADIDEDVAGYANGILDRGFRSVGDSQV
jgi:hypothetical protein